MKIEFVFIGFCAYVLTAYPDPYSVQWWALLIGTVGLFLLALYRDDLKQNK